MKMHDFGKGVSILCWGNRSTPNYESIKSRDDPSTVKENYGLVSDGGRQNNDPKDIKH